MPRLLGVDGDLVERLIELEIDLIHALHARQTNEDVNTVLFGNFHERVRRGVAVFRDDENVAQNRNDKNAHDDCPNSVGNLHRKLLDTVRGQVERNLLKNVGRKPKN